MLRYKNYQVVIKLIESCGIVHYLALPYSPLLQLPSPFTLTICTELLLVWRRYGRTLFEMVVAKNAHGLGTSSNSCIYYISFHIGKLYNFPERLYNFPGRLYNLCFN